MKFMFVTLLAALTATSFAQFKSEDSASINITGGNTDQKNYAFKSANSYTLSKSTYKLNGGYYYGESDGVRSSENWDIGLRFDYALFPKTGFYFGEIVEADRFAGYDRRYNTDLGITHVFYKTDTTSLLAESGLRYTIEKPLTNTEDQKDLKGRIYLEATDVLRENIKGKLWAEYLPNFSESDDYQVNIEPSLTVTLNSIFSMKTAYLWKLRNDPPAGNSKYDYNYTLTLIASF